MVLPAPMGPVSSSRLPGMVPFSMRADVPGMCIK
jgi:hypothetical protein